MASFERPDDSWASAPGAGNAALSRTVPAHASLQRRRTQDADEHAESLRRWDQHYEQLTPGGFSGDLAEAWIGEVQVFREVTNQVVFQAGRAWPGACTVGVVLDMQGEGTFCDQPLSAGTGFAFGAPGEFTLRSPEKLDVVGIAVSESLLERTVERTSEPGLAALTHARPGTLPSSDGLEALRRLVRAFFEAIETDPTPFREVRAQRDFVSSLLGGISAVAGNAAESSPTLASARARSRVVDLARSYILDRRDMPVTVADLCAEAGVSRRTLQYSFQEVLGVSPVQYLRAVRLNGVRRELKRAGPGERVGDVAARWGFWHLSQFSADYRRMFGELPSETRRAGRA